MIMFIAGILLLLYIYDMLHKKLAVDAEITRKLAHFTSTATTLVFPLLFTNHWYVLALAVVFFLLLLMSMNTRYLRSIHAIERYSTGSFLLPPAIYLSFLISLKTGQPVSFYMPIVILAVSDPLAGITGYFCKKNNPEIYLLSRNLHKTLFGSSAFFISSLILCLAIFSIMSVHTRLSIGLASLCIASISTLTELLSTKGTDNLTVPLVVILTISLLI